MPSFNVPKSGTVGEPAGVKGRAELQPDEFTFQVETMGYRLAWSRACRCPCAPVNDQTEQADPNCELCSGRGWLQFRPELAVMDPHKVGDLDTLQKRILSENTASLIFGVMTGFASTARPWEATGQRYDGSAQLTVRHENKIGHLDRIVNLDVLIPYTQRLQLVDDGRVPLRYYARAVNLMRTFDQVFTKGTHFEVTDGDVTWVGDAPAAGTWLAVHYLVHPTYRIWSWPHVLRSTRVKRKTTSKIGVNKDLPIQAMVQYEWLVDKPE